MLSHSGGRRGKDLGDGLRVVALEPKETSTVVGALHREDVGLQDARAELGLEDGDVIVLDLEAGFHEEVLVKVRGSAVLLLEPCGILLGRRDLGGGTLGLEPLESL